MPSEMDCRSDWLRDRDDGSLIKLANAARKTIGSQLAIRAEVLGSGESLAAQRDHAGRELGALAQSVRRGQRGDTSQ